jgi:glycosyltransferase involved in cell wall biosynthesis
VHTIYNPVISDDLLQRARQPLDHPWFRSGEPPVILAVGRLAPQKDFGMLLSAFEIVRQNRPARLMILGQGAERPALEAEVVRRSLGDSVSLPGFADNPYAYMDKAALFALSSRYEGLPTVLIEALAAGCPIVATDCPSGPREILRDGRYGKLAPVGDAPAFAAALLGALDEPRRAAPAESWNQYTLSHAVARYIDVLQI